MSMVETGPDLKHVAGKNWERVTFTEIEIRNF